MNQCNSMSGCSRNFFTKSERADMLKEYKDSLEKEAQGVGEKIKDLEAK